MILASPSSSVAGVSSAVRRVAGEDRGAGIGVTPTADRFMRKVDQDGLGGCWIWKGGRGTKGYGHFHMPTAGGGRKTVMAHRFAYELLVGPIPSGLHIDHLCGVRACVNPAHLEPVTVRLNNLRSARHERPSVEHCVRGHLLIKANRINRPDGRTECSVCRQERRRAALAGSSSDAGGALTHRHASASLPTGGTTVSPAPIATRGPDPATTKNGRRAGVKTSDTPDRSH